MKLLTISLADLSVFLLNSCCRTACQADPASDTGNQNTGNQIRINVFFTANNDADIQEIKAVADSLVTASRNDAGCIDYDFLESTTTPGLFMIIETWENDSLLKIHSQAPHFKKYVPRLNELGQTSSRRFSIEN